MALPQTHTIATAPIVGISLWLYPLKTWENAVLMAGVIFFGIFLDIDHLSPQRIKRVLKDDWTPLEDYKNFLYTWQALVVAAALSIIINHYLPLISFIAHLLIDGANDHNKVCKNSPFLRWLNRFYPAKLKYYLGPEKVPSTFSKIAKFLLKKI